MKAVLMVLGIVATAAAASAGWKVECVKKNDEGKTVREYAQCKPTQQEASQACRDEGGVPVFASGVRCQIQE